MKIYKTFKSHYNTVIYNGDCIDLLKTVDDNVIKLIVTSPPYNIGKSYEKRKKLTEYLLFQETVIKECVRVMHPEGSLCWQVGNFVENGEIIPLDLVLYPIFQKLGLKLRNRIIWHFGHGLHASKRLSGRYEVILWFTKTDNYTFNLDPIRVKQKYPHKKHFKGPNKGKLSGNPLGKNPSDVWDIPNVKANHIEKTIHPCQFPIELIERLVLSMTNKNDWVLDPFLGVGSTSIAALMHKRKSAGAEISKEYVEIAMERVKDAIAGKLQIRPKDREVFDPTSNNYIPPKTVKINKVDEQLEILS